MSKKIETNRVGILGDEPLLTMDVAYKARHEFIKTFWREPSQIRVSPGAFDDLRSMVERTTDTVILENRLLGMDIKVDHEMEPREWQVCKEDTKVYAV